jgi:hypothetical protein
VTNGPEGAGVRGEAEPTDKQWLLGQATWHLNHGVGDCGDCDYPAEVIGLLAEISELQAKCDEAVRRAEYRTADLIVAEETVQRLRGEVERHLIALWRIRMACQRSSVDDPPSELPNVVTHLAEGGMGKDRRNAQALAAQLHPPLGEQEEGTK